MLGHMDTWFQMKWEIHYLLSCDIEFKYAGEFYLVGFNSIVMLTKTWNLLCLYINWLDL